MVQDATERVRGVAWMTMLMARHWLDYRSDEDLTRDVLLVTSFDNQKTPGMCASSMPTFSLRTVMRTCSVTESAAFLLRRTASKPSSNPWPA